MLTLYTYYESLLNEGVFGGAKLYNWQYRTSKQKKHISGNATIPMPLLIPFGTTELPLQDGMLDELLSFCFFVPQQPAAILQLQQNQTPNSWPADWNQIKSLATMEQGTGHETCKLLTWNTFTLNKYFAQQEMKMWVNIIRYIEFDKYKISFVKHIS